MFLLDTDILIDVQRGHAPAVAWFSSLSDLPGVPGLVVMELVQGCRDSRQVRGVLRLAGPLPVVWPTADDGRRALTDFSTFHLSHGLGLLDALIAATAVGAGAELCTFNAKHYRFVPGIAIVQPYQR
ncbi:MAG: type II toxin-antitoxin system VapC family toxin [Planctomycetia bacterium]